MEERDKQPKAGEAGRPKEGDDFGSKLKRVWVEGVRTLAVPVARGYATDAPIRDQPGGEKPDDRLDDGEIEALKRAAQKLVVEAGELGLRAYPPLEAGEVPRASYDAASDSYGQPTLAYLVSAAKAVGAWRKSASAAEPSPSTAQSAAVYPAPARTPTPGMAVQSFVPRSARIRRAAPVREVPMTRTLRFASTAVGPAAGLPPRVPARPGASAAGAPRVVAAPPVVVAPRRAAGAPQSARPISARATGVVAPPAIEVAAPAQPPPTAPPAAPAPTYAPAAPHKAGCGCGCGAYAAPIVAQRAASGECEVKIFDFDCDTRSRLAQCLKVIICDFLICVGDQLCQDGKLVLEKDASGREPGDKLIDCLGGLVCSAVRCIPEALCPPEPPIIGTCNTLPCSFAVEDA